MRVKGENMKFTLIETIFGESRAIAIAQKQHTLKQVAEQLEDIRLRYDGGGYLLKLANFREELRKEAGL